tara:strand:+ start:693 stop:1196 length:504 start_codon:yes stop_codon:yes gene_type:complete
MNTPTPEQQRKVQEAGHSVDQYWYADLSTKELRRKPLKGFPKFVNLFWKKRHPVWEFFWWLVRRRAQDDMILLSNPIESDNMPIKGFPMKYELKGGWTIPSVDLKYLVEGPLASQGLSEVIVPHALGWKRFLLFIRQFGVLLTTLITIAGATIRWWAELVEFWNCVF